MLHRHSLQYTIKRIVQKNALPFFYVRRRSDHLGLNDSLSAVMNRIAAAFACPTSYIFLRKDGNVPTTVFDGTFKVQPRLKSRDLLRFIVAETELKGTQFIVIDREILRPKTGVASQFQERHMKSDDTENQPLILNYREK